MKPGKLFCLILIMAATSCLKGQDTWHGAMAPRFVMYNPSFSGVSGESHVNMSCTSFFPGTGYGLKAVYGSWDGYIEPLHGGLSVWISDDMPGEVLNDLRCGMAYAYHLKAGNRLFFNAGLTASVIHIGINSSSVILPEETDPFTGITGIASEIITGRGRTMLDLGAGVSFSTGNWYGGLSVMHLNRPWLSTEQQSFNRIRSLCSVNAGAHFTVYQQKLQLHPYVTALIQGGTVISSFNVLCTWSDLILGAGIWNINNGFTALVPSAGWKTGLSTVTISYSYSISSSSGVFPSSAIVRAGLSLSIGNVHKRKPVHVIKLPEM